jgi:hypothetical protein
VIRYARNKRTAADSRWVSQLLKRRCPRIASVALANKTARIAWAILARGEAYLLWLALIGAPACTHRPIWAQAW